MTLMQYNTMSVYVVLIHISVDNMSPSEYSACDIDE